MSKAQLEKRAISAAHLTLKGRGYVSAADVFLGMGTLSRANYESGRRGHVPYLEQVIQGNLSKISDVMRALRRWAGQQGLFPSETVYRRWGNGPKRDLRFSKTGAPAIELVYRTHYVSPKLRSGRDLSKAESATDNATHLVMAASEGGGESEHPR